jgi:ABC-2 type transport system ATP-binding protein
MGVFERLARFIFRIATGDRNTRWALTPVGGLLFSAFVLFFVGAALLTDRFLRLAAIVFSPWTEITGLLLLTIGLALVIVVGSSLIRAHGTPVPVNPPDKLITNGLFAHIRNPMMLGLFLSMFGAGIFIGSMSLTLIYTPMAVAFFTLYLKKIEEKELEPILSIKKECPCIYREYTANGVKVDESPVIVAAGLTKRFGDVTAVDNLCLNIRRGEIYGFLGLNGAGKTTTIRMLLGMIKPGAGSVSLFGTMIRPGVTAIWRRVGYMVETPHAYPDLTVLENLEMVRNLRRLKEAAAVAKITEQLGLTPYARRRAGTLSLGNAQRLGLAKALIHQPDLLILDEPANALDPAGIVEIRNLLRALAQNNGVTIFISSHILSEVARLATRIGVIHEGKLVKELNTGELAAQEDRYLAVDVGDAGKALTVLEQAGVAARSTGRNSLVVTGQVALQHPEEVSALLAGAGCPPSRLVIAQGMCRGTSSPISSGCSA